MNPTAPTRLLDVIAGLSPGQVCALTPSEAASREPAALTALIVGTSHGWGPVLVDCDLALADLGPAFLDTAAAMAARDALYALVGRRWLPEEDYLVLTRPLRAVGVMVHEDDPLLPAGEVIPSVIPEALAARVLAVKAIAGDAAAQEAVVDHQMVTGWRYLVAARRWVFHREHAQPVYLHDDSDCLAGGHDVLSDVPRPLVA